MKVSTVSTHSHLACLKVPRCTKKLTARHMLSASNQSAVKGSLAVVKRAISTSRLWSEQRTSCVEELRGKVKVGAYHVDSVALARCILISETHLS